MNELEKMVLNEGSVLDNGVLKVDHFIILIQEANIIQVLAMRLKIT